MVEEDIEKLGINNNGFEGKKADLFGPKEVVDYNNKMTEKRQTAKRDKTLSSLEKNKKDFRHKSNLLLASSLTLLCLVAHEAFDFDSISNPLSLRFLPRWSSLVGILVGAVMTNCCLISFLGYKSSFVLSLTGYIVSLLFHFFPSTVPLTISGFIEGICWLLLTVALSSYVTQLAIEYCETNERTSRDAATSKYLAAPYFFQKLAELALLIFDQLVQNKQSHAHNQTSINATLTSSVADCYHNQPSLMPFTSINTTSYHQEHLKMNTDEYSVNNVIIGASGGACSIAIAGIYHFLDNKHSVYHAEHKTRSIRYNFLSSLYVFKDKTLWLTIPIITYMGMVKAFVYNKGITYNIYCKDTSYIHLFTVYTTVCCLCSATYHTFGERIISSILVIISLVIHSALLTVEIFGFTKSIYVQYMLVLVLAITEVSMYCHIKGTFGNLYEGKKETSYTLFEVFQKIGFYIFHIVLAVVHGKAKVIGLLVCLVAGGVCYLLSKKIVRRKGTLHRFDIPYFL